MIIALAAAILAAAFMWERGFTHIYLANMPSVIMWACGQGLVDPARIPDELASFMSGEVGSLACETVTGIETNNAGPFLYSQFYLAGSVAILWRIFGVDYQYLMPLAALLHAAYAVGSYALARFFLPAAIAAVVGLVIAFSPLALSHLESLRDFSKASFIVWGAFLILAATRANRPGGLLLLAAAGGLAIGIGTGFRVDVAILFPVGLVVFLLAGSSVPGLHYRLVGGFVFALAYALAAFPVFQGSGAQGGGGFLLLQGLTEPYSRHLAVEPAVYDFGARYSDELTLYALASDMPREGGWPVRSLIEQSTGYALPLLALFPADLAVRALKAAGWSAGLHALLAPEMRALDPAAYPYPAAMAAAQLAVRPYSGLAVAWLPWLGLAGLCALFLRSHSRSAREAIALFLVFAALMGYGAFQFALRNVFHLEFITLVSLGALLAFIWRPSETIKNIRSFMAVFSLVVVVGIVCLLSLIQYQASSVARHVAALVDNSRSVPLERLSEEGAVYRFARPDDAVELASHAEPHPGFDPIEASADRHAVFIGGDGCPLSAFDLAVEYEAHPEAWQPLDRVYRVGERVEGETKVAIIAAFHSPTQSFDRIVLPASHSACMQGAARLAGQSPLPSLFGGVFSDDPARNRLYQLPGWFR